MSKNIKVIIVKVGQPAYEAEIPDTLESMQGIVGGYVEHVRLGRGFSLWCNEEGLIRDLPANRMIGPATIIHGDFFITGGTDDGDTVGLTDEQVNFVLPLVAVWPAFVDESAAESN